MQTSVILLIASLGAISVLLILYIYIFMFERRFFFGPVVYRMDDYCRELRAGCFFARYAAARSPGPVIKFKFLFLRQSFHIPGNVLCS